MGLTERDRALLDLAGRAWFHPSAQEQAMVELTGWPPIRCWQRLNLLLEEPAAWEYAPLTCARLDRRRRVRRSAG